MAQHPDPDDLPVLDDRLVRHLGELARLELPDARRDDLRQKLQQLVGAFAELQAIDFDDAAANAHGDDSGIGPGQARELRADAADAASPRDDVLHNAPRTAADSFVVPRVVEP